MSDQALSTTDQPTKAQLAHRERSAPLKVTGRLKRALDLMVWENQTDSQAAVKTKMTVTAIRLALRRPHVLAYVRGQREVLLERECGRNIHTLVNVRDQKRNQMARVQAVKALEQMDDQPAAASGRQSVAGLVLILGSGTVADMGHIREIEAKPLIQQKVVPHEE